MLEGALPFQSAPECAGVNIVFVKGTVGMVNHFVFAFPGGYEQSSLNELTEALNGAVHTNWKPLISAAIVYARVSARGLQSLIDLESTNSFNTGACGQAGAGMPNNVSWAIKFRTGATGRSARGRMYVIGLTDQTVDSAKAGVTAAHGAAWLAALEATRVAAATAGWQHVVLSRRTNGALRPTATHRAITEYAFTNLLLDSQRGRLAEGH